MKFIFFDNDFFCSIIVSILFFTGCNPLGGDGSSNVNYTAIGTSSDGDEVTILVKKNRVRLVNYPKTRGQVWMGNGACKKSLGNSADHGCAPVD
jgi:hypothetical protein